MNKLAVQSQCESEHLRYVLHHDADKRLYQYHCHPARHVTCQIMQVRQTTISQTYIQHTLCRSDVPAGNSFIASGILGSPCPLVPTHVLHIQLCRPAKLLLSNFCCSPDSLCITTSSGDQLVLALFAAGFLKCLHMRQPLSNQSWTIALPQQMLQGVLMISRIWSGSALLKVSFQTSYVCRA